MLSSRLGSIVIDCDDIAAGTAFWSQALGMAVADSDEVYVALEYAPDQIRILLQRVPEPKTAKTRVHLDIETDDVAAEVARLVALGAKRRTAPLLEDAVMEDPCGNEFCSPYPVRLFACRQWWGNEKPERWSALTVTPDLDATTWPARRIGVFYNERQVMEAGIKEGKGHPHAGTRPAGISRPATRPGSRSIKNWSCWPRI
jgi:catechol 2,3-dioxygenase-like lactoylglutathione lyase family enzyme